MKKKKIATKAFIAVLLVGLIISCSETSETKSAVADCPTKTCGDFSSQAQAQSAYDSDKKCYKNLDADGDGIACENLSK
ncbi:excalibur calcium-binding domain-containing protein [Flavobacterium sp. N3904]|uniref:excalibur calcium-binding domain-containing protein n=1 Tax=Flavobacterium sp. N3904 TaxID=2986835 RepID=UPI0022251569|nr:excalibur calcium-binding domain-containing protein [Flavobacterium sp. N3904]